MSKLHLTVISQEKKLLDLKVDEVVVPTTEGEIGVLPDHIPLFAKLKPGELRYKQSGKEYSVVISAGFLNVDEEGNVTVIVDSAFEARSLSLKRIQKAIKEAKTNLANAKTKEELIKAEAQMRFALMQEKIAQKTKLIRG